MYLNCHTYYSLKYGTLSPAQLVQEASKKGIDSLVLTDINNTSCAYSFIQACKKHEIKPILGIEFRSTVNPTTEDDDVSVFSIKDARFAYVGIARNKEGWKELNAHLTAYSMKNEPVPMTAPAFKHAYVIYRQLPPGHKQLRSNEYIGVMPGEVNQLFSSYLLNYMDKLVVFAPITFRDQDGYKTHKLLRCIDLNIVIGKLDPLYCAKASEFIYPPGDILKIFERYPQIIANTEALLSRCSIEMHDTSLNNRQTFTGSRGGDMKLLRKLAINGCIRRYGERNRNAMTRTMKELEVIDKLGFAAYFLITWDIVRYAQTAGYHHVGRGSGANSIVAFNLFITDVDPMDLDLYFERFINPHRTSPPDFDIDFSWDERDDVTDYIFKRYGKEHTALLATYNTFKGKSIIRELGKVLGLPKADIDTVVNEPLAKEKHHPFAKHIFKYGKFIEGFPNYLSIHAGGILISEEPLNYHTALQMMPKGFATTHFDMYGAEDLNFHKYDILSQRGLGHIKDAVKLVARNQGKAVDVHDVKAIKDDIEVRKQLKSGQCIGCFYIESPAMRGLLTKLACDNYVHLVAASSIIRPGVAKSGMMREYIQRFHDPESFNYIHPVFEEHLRETFGVMVYQEDVMKIVHHFAGLDLDESDVLRRIMTGKKKNSDTFERLREKYFRNCKTRGYPEGLAEEVWRQIASFSGYSFCKAHSASFAVESFQSLYLKTYFPKEFMVAVINNFGGFYSTELYVHEARMCGANIEAPCINHSTYLTNIYGDDVYIGLIHIAQLEKKTAITIVHDRQDNGPYQSLEDFVRRINISKEQLELLIRVGAFRFTGLNKYALMWEKNAVHNPEVKYNGSGHLFGMESEEYDLPILQETRSEQAFDEIELLGFPLCSPFELLDDTISGDIHTRDLKRYMHKTVRMVGYFVTRKNVTTVNRKLMNFGTWLDREGKFFDTTHFPPSLARYPFRGKGCYLITGKVVEDFGFPSLEVTKMEKLPYVKDERY
ncbi:MAG: DNA polymerase III subunit alpha [Saprospiraceae bacterium]|nr:DNA polymerase III subunit alpha [Saprospiraceae bacterium]